MIRSFRRHAAQGFTLIELLIVVIIIAILAAIAIPQFANTSGDAQESALSANLSTMRSAIELYKVQHRNVLPSVASAIPTTNATACTGTPGKGAAGSNTAFVEQLTMFSNANGDTCSVRDTGNVFALGPYLKAIPDDSITNPPTHAVVVNATGTLDVAPTDATGGYQFDNRSGRLVMNSNVTGRRAIPYWQY